MISPDIVKQYVMNETFVGKEPVRDIQKAMDKIREKYMANIRGKLNNTPEDRALEAAIKDLFGFRMVDVFWSDSASIRGGPCTVPNAVIFHNGPAKSYTYGKNQKGFYDKDHELHCVIHMNSSIFDKAGLTSEEAVAVLLHEIGHNFDYSPYSILNTWFEVFMIVINALKMNWKVVINAASNYTFKELGPSVLVRMMNIDTVIADIVPPFRYVSKFFNTIHGGLSAFGTAVLSPLIFLVAVPTQLINSPFRYILNFFTRKKERYADSFAAMYGYAAEQATALDKLINDASGVDGVAYNIPVLKSLYDLSRLNNEIIAAAMGDHESNQKRVMNMMDMMKEDLKDPNLSPALKKELRIRYDNCVKTYNDMLNLNNDQRDTLTAIFRRMMDNWYAGRNYLFIPSTGDDYVK